MRDQITSIHFRNYKAFHDFSVRLESFNVLVGPNNAGKSTVLGSLRLLAEALRRAMSRNPEWIGLKKGYGEFGYRVHLDNLPVSTENVFHNYDDSEHAVITFRISNGNTLKLVFPEKGVAYLLPNAAKQIRSVSAFKKAYDLKIAFVPILGPVDHNEKLYQREAARSALLSSFASRNFRNIWHHFPEGFREFREAVKRTWPGMDIEPPEITTIEDEAVLHMFCPEERYPREIFWAGFGFQVWCQMLTFVLQAKDASLLVVDEPDIYLHSDLQRQLVNLLQELECPLVLATHSMEIISEVDPECILTINKRFRAARRVANTRELQQIFSVLGSGLNPALTQIAKTRRVVFLEGKDFQILSRFARKLGFEAVANRADFAVVSVEGFSPSKVRDFSEGMEATLGCKLLKAVVFDRDYRSRGEAAAIKRDLDKHCDFAAIHSCKEVENFLLNQAVVTRAINAALRKKGAAPITEEEVVELLRKLTDGMKNRVQSHFVKHHVDFERRQVPGIDSATASESAMNAFDTIWSDISQRLSIVPGKELFSALNSSLQERHAIHLSQMKVIDEFARSEVAPELVELLKSLDRLRKQEMPS
jgi:energy-coupling factor transporter ATP-binding protein EcfA2